jgi:hypothetical protein
LYKIIDALIDDDDEEDVIDNNYYAGSIVNDSSEESVNVCDASFTICCDETLHGSSTLSSNSSASTSMEFISLHNIQRISWTFLLDLYYFIT